MRQRIANLIERSHIEKQLLASFPGRNHVFTGSARGIEKCFFKRYPDQDSDLMLCILSQLYLELYPQNTKSPDKLVWYENMRYDCTFFREPRKMEKGLYCRSKEYPISWDMDWIIEVENDIGEFAYTLRTLLDVNCRRCLGIFFYDEFDVEDANELFRKYWEKFLDQYPLKNNPVLYAIVYPERYETLEQYLNNSRSLRWECQKKVFVDEEIQ